MKRTMKYVMLAALAAVCVLFLWVNVNRRITVPQPTQAPTTEAMDVQDQQRQMIHKLTEAPWLGLRFLPTEKEWRFYAVAGETRTVKLSAQFDLVKVYFLQADGDLGYTWAATGVDIPGHGYYSATSALVTEGDLIEVAITGDYVTQNGVNWEGCDTEYCRLASMVDTLIVLDDEGTGLTNGFIRYGWALPTHPMYGFLCWQIRPYTVHQIASNNTNAH